MSGQKMMKYVCKIFSTKLSLSCQYSNPDDMKMKTDGV